jgi:hypothetical protein
MERVIAEAEASVRNNKCVKASEGAIRSMLGPQVQYYLDAMNNGLVRMAAIFLSTPEEDITEAMIRGDSVIRYSQEKIRSIVPGINRNQEQIEKGHLQTLKAPEKSDSVRVQRPQTEISGKRVRM